MMKSAIVLVLLWLVTGCPVSTTTSTSTMPRGSGVVTGPPAGPDANGNITIPNVFGMSKEQAIAELRRAGFQGDVTDDSSLCGSLIDGRVIELGIVCYQHPPAGRVQGARLPISIRVQSENPWHGNVGKLNEWRLMPDLVGMSVEQARAEMKRVGFDRDDRVFLSWVDEPSCKPLTVCRTHPEALQRVGVSSTKVVVAGRDPTAKPKDEAPVSDPSKPTDPVDPKAPADSSSPAKPESGKTEPQAEPFF